MRLFTILLGLGILLYSCQFAFAQTDTTAPVLKLRGDSLVCIHIGDQYYDEGVTVTDNYSSSKDMTLELEGWFLLNKDKAGCWTMRWKAIDTSGNVGYSSWRYIMVRPKGDSSPCVYNDDSCKRWATLGLEKNFADKNSVNVYPNPATEKATIEIKSSAGQEISIRILDVSGRCILNKSAWIDPHHSKIELNTADMKSGYYFIEIGNGNWQRVLSLSITGR
jgi:hypothetical protein